LLGFNTLGTLKRRRKVRKNSIREINNMYLGGGISDLTEIPATMNAIDNAVTNNIVVVAAAGNTGFIAPGMPNEFRSMIYPAAYEPVISAGVATYAYVDPENSEYLGEFAPFNPATLEFNALKFLDDGPEGDNGKLVGPALEAHGLLRVKTLMY
jgi:subtilisin family serine protease